MALKFNSIILRYHEIALKGDNRIWFEKQLAKNAQKAIARVLGDDADIQIKRQRGRIVLTCEWNEKVKEALRHVFGIANFSPVTVVPTEFETIQARLLEEARILFEAEGVPKTFRVRTRRSDKVLDKTSTELDRELGSPIKQAFEGLRVDLNRPEVTLGVEVRKGESFIWTQKIPGPGGLPVGTNSPLLTLISGGIDSPVAAIQIMKRGASSHFLHFFGTPFVGDDVLEKIKDLTAIANRFQPKAADLWVVPFGKLQEKIALVTQPKMRTLLYRRMMMRIANQVGKKLKARALVTGESLGQVASQTIENITSIENASELPIIRPLVTQDKDEIIAQAQNWGSYQTSILPGIDCCTLFADRGHPSLRAPLETILEEESKFPVAEYVDEALEGLYKIEVGAARY